MGRKDRKRARKNRGKNRKKKEFKDDIITNEELWLLAKKLTLFKWDKRHYNKPWYHNGKRGCWNLVGERAYCDGCFYDRGCMKHKHHEEIIPVVCDFLKVLNRRKEELS